MAPVDAPRPGLLSCCLGHLPTRAEFEAFKAQIVKSIDDTRHSAQAAGDDYRAAHAVVAGDVKQLGEGHAALAGDLAGIKSQLAALKAPTAPTTSR